MVAGLARIISESREANVKASGERTYRRQYIVETNNKFDDEQVVLSAPGLPQRYFPFVTRTQVDFQALAVEVTARAHPSGEPRTWLVEAIFTTEHDRKSKAQQVLLNPLAEPPEFDVSFESFRVAAGASLGGTGNEFGGAIKNSAGEMFDPQPERDESRPVLTISRNEQFFSLRNAANYANAVNSDFFLGASPRQAMMKGIKGVKQNRKGFSFWKVTYTIAFNRRTWDIPVVDQGTYYIEDTKKIPFKDEQGNRITGLLDGSGGKLSDNASPVVGAFQVYKVLPFFLLQLPPNINLA